jgi:endonuclease G, mitochondrial
VLVVCRIFFRRKCAEREIDMVTIVNPNVPPAAAAGGAAAIAAVEQALAEFEAARAQPYYEEATDRTDRDAYYSPLGAGAGHPPPASALSNHLESTHTTRVHYDSGRSVYTWADLHEDLKLRSIYSGVTFDPRDAIADVVLLDQQIKAVEARMAEGRMSESAGLQEIDLLQAASPYNCEHVVPQSWFRRSEPMRGDMHHLFACGNRCNSFRGNTPYFDFADFQEVVQDDCGKSERVDSSASGFEPKAGKAVVARATLYFLLRYPGRISKRSLPADRIPTLLAWHRNTAPDRYERHRNQAIFKRQGNRSPLIDFPEWADTIDFAALLAST